MSPALLALALAVGADDELARALKTVTAGESYSFTLKAGAGTPVEGSYQKGLPAHFVAERIEFFRQGDVLVYRQAESWQRTRTGRLSDPLPILGASAKVKAARLPHEELATVSGEMTDVGKAPAKDETVYTAVLPNKVAKELARNEDRDLTQAGTVAIRVDGKGRVTGYEVSIQVKGRRGNADVDGTFTRTVTIKDIDTAKVEVPDGAKKAME